MLRSLSLLAFATGLGVLVVTGIFASLKLQSVEPLQGSYGNQAMLAFELAATPADLARVIGPNPPAANALAVRQAMDHANHIDFIYMALYGAFIAFSCAHLALVKKRNWLLIAALLGPIAACFDVAENLALLSLTRADAGVLPLLASLHVRTFAKWELLALTSAMFAAGYVRRRLCRPRSALDKRCRTLSQPHCSHLRHPRLYESTQLRPTTGLPDRSSVAVAGSLRSHRSLSNLFRGPSSKPNAPDLLDGE